MLICPQCEFENSAENRFCQNCGVSLTYKVCCECHENIPIEAKTCKLCGAANDTILWAIISQKKAKQELEAKPELTQITSNLGNSPAQLEIENLPDLFAESQEKTSLTPKIQPDTTPASNRYTLKCDSSSQTLFQTKYRNLDNTFLQGKVIDQYPLQKSHLATLQKQQIDLFAELTQDLDRSYLAASQHSNLVGLPTHALPYLILEKYTPIVPKIYDAWQQQDQGIVLLPDRSQWKLLTELWSEQKLSLLQIVWFLDEMAKLWKPFQQISCAQSLLIKENLRIDEDQAFCLQQLYLDLDDDAPTLKDLAQTWQFCLAESGLADLSQLNLLLDKIMAGDITLIEQLRLELHNFGLDESEVESFNVDYINSVSVNTFPSESEIPESQPNPSDFEAENFFEETDEEMMYSSEFEEQATAMIPMHLRDVTAVCCTDVGSLRDHNEDFFGVKTSIEKTENNNENSLSARGLYLVCDGMGGHAAGEVASAMAVENLQKYFQTHWQSELPDHNTIEEGVLLANKALYQTNINNSRSGSGRMGTTLVMALLQDTQLAIAHVGDSRIYRISRKQGLEQLTLDHEVGQREINRGVEPEIAYGRPDAYQLTQALGPRESNYVRPETQFMEITEDCLLLLCSDGLSDNELIEQHWSEYLEPLISSKADLQDGLFKLIDLANQHNGHDNITAVLLRIKLKPDF